MEVATLLASEDFGSEERVIPFKEIIPLLKQFIGDFCTQNKIAYDQDKEITYKNTKITFYLNYSPKVHKYFLCFKPKNIWKYSYKSVLLPAFQETIEFFETLPICVNIGEVMFSKPKITGTIDISSWNFTTDPDIGINRLSQIKNFGEIRKLGEILYAKKAGLLKKHLLLIDNCGIINNSKRKRIMDKISPLFSSSETIQYSESIIEKIDTRMDINNLFVLFLGKKETLDEKYSYFKKYFISKGIPSQFIVVDNVDKIMDYGFENLLFELIKKSQQMDAIYLNAVMPSKTDALLCLSDINAIESNKIFGISISLTGAGETDEWLEVYNDIDYTTRLEEIRFEQGELTKLGEKIDALSSLQGKTIDIFVTRRWHTRDVGYLCRTLEKYNVKVRKFLYIGSKANRFLFSSLPYEQEMLCKHPYLIWSDRVASLQTNSRIQLYGTMFPIYIELLNPWNTQKLDEEDLRMILWLVKKRVYRIANFYNLKTPELLALFDHAKKLNIENVSGKLKISLHTLI